MHNSGPNQLTQLLWSGYCWKDLFLQKNLGVSDAYFGKRRWRQKWNKGQCLSKAVHTSSIGNNGLKYVIVFWKHDSQLLQEGCSNIPQTFILFHFWTFFIISRLSQNDCSLLLNHPAAVWLEAVTVKDHYNLKNHITEPMVRTGNEFLQKIWNINF